MTKKQRTTKALLLGALATSLAIAGGALTYGKLALDSFNAARDTASEPNARIIKGSFQQRDFDELVVRISNPTTKTQSLSEPAIRCTTADQSVRYLLVATDSPDLAPMPTFPAPSSFPMQLAPGGTVETTVFVRRMLGVTSAVAGLPSCRKMRFSWLDARQKQQEGSEYSLSPNVAMFVSVGPGS